MSPHRTAFALLLAAMIAGRLGSATALAAAFEVAPTTIELSPGGGAALVRITNRGAQAVTIQVRTFDWRQSGDRDYLTPSTGLAASPTTAQLPPGGRRTIRLRERGPASTGEHAHRLLISELASGAVAAPGRVRMLLRFSLPVFRPAGETSGAARLVWDARIAGGQLIVTAANPGPRHAKLVNLAVVGDGAPTRNEVAPMVYVLANASRSWRLPAGAIVPTANLTLKAEDALTGRPLIWILQVHRPSEGSTRRSRTYPDGPPSGERGSDSR